jgi:uncharacterized membrane protein
MPPSTDAESPLTEQIDQNLEKILAFQKQKWEQRSWSQRCVERISAIIGRPTYLFSLVLFAMAWVIINHLQSARSRQPFDPFPYPLLDGVLTLGALVSTTVILIAQNRQSRLDQQHTHLALQVNLLTEQKATKIIHLLEELRRDMPMVKDRHDSQAEVLQRSADAAHVLSAIEKAGLIEDSPQEDPGA